MGDWNGWALLSDQQTGLIPSVVELLPNAEHRMCARHIYSNWGQKYKGKQLMRQFWKCAKSTNMADFEVHRKRLKEMSPQGHDDLFHTEPKLWCKAFFDTNIKCDVVDNNLSEAFNGRCVEARCKAIVSMLKDIRIMVMTRMHTHRDACARWTINYGPRIVHKLHLNTIASRYCHLVWNGDDGFEIEEGSTKYVVDSNLKTCSGRAWKVSGVPCCHAICAIHYKKYDPGDYLAECFTKDKYLNSYQFMMPPVRGEKFWEKTNKETPQPPPMKTMPGRSKMNRIKQPIELVRGDRMTKEGKRMTCSSCNVVGHSCKGCTLKKANGQASAQSQAKSTRSRPEKGQPKAIATTSAYKGGSTSSASVSTSTSASASVEAGAIVQNNSGHFNAFAHSSASASASANVSACSGQANAFAEVNYDEQQGICFAQATAISQDRPQKIPTCS